MGLLAWMSGCQRWQQKFGERLGLVEQQQKEQEVKIAELAGELATVKGTLDKALAEIQTKIDTLNVKIEELMAQIEGMDDVPAEVTAALAEVKTAATALDDIVPG